MKKNVFDNVFMLNDKACTPERILRSTMADVGEIKNIMVVCEMKDGCVTWGVSDMEYKDALVLWAYLEELLKRKIRVEVDCEMER